MIIRRVEVQNFRKLVEPVVVENLPDGLAIVVGDNEEGKSTLLNAIRSCFFDKHNMTGERAQSFQPYNSIVRPEVRVDFEINGQHYKLFKAFCHKAEAELTTPTGRLMDAAAEEELARLLRFTPPQRARRDASDHEHEGIFGMFWVEQGQSFIGVNPTSEGRNSIRQALQHEVGGVLGGKRGQRILAEVAKMRGVLLTSTGRPKGEHAKAVDSVSKIQQELATVKSTLNDYDRKLGDLERYRTRQRRYETERTLERAEERLRQAREAADDIETLRHTADQAHAKLAKASVANDLAADRAKQRTKLIDEVAACKRKVSELKIAWDLKQQSLADVRHHSERKEKELSEAVQRFEDTHASYATAAAAEQLARTQSDLDNIIRRENEATQAKAKAEKALQAAALIRIEKKDITRLQRLQETVTEARAQLSALATNVRIDLEKGVKARIARAAVVSGAEHRITETTAVEVIDYAKITIVPGGDIANPQSQLKRAQENFQRALTEHGVAKLAEAESKLDERQGLVNEAKNYQELIHAHTPEGLEVLQANIAELRGEVQRLTKQVGGKPKSLKDAAAALKTAQGEHNVAEEGRKLAEKRAVQARKELVTAQTDEAGFKASYESEAGRLQELEHRLAEERKATSDDELQKTIVEAAQEVTTAEQTEAAARHLLENANPDAVGLELSAAEGALAQLQKDQRELSDRVISLESELRAIGAQGLGERCQQLEADLQEAKTIATALDRQAKTIELLYSVLTEAERAAKETFLRPVTDRVQPYLKLLLPGTELRLSDEMDIVGLRRGGFEEEFQALSLGTREQLAVLTRLAFADLLRENGQLAAVLLDDAIVFADDERFKRMLHILRKAAEKTQVIVFTCHEQNYETAGAPIIRLAECRGGSTNNAAA